MKLHPLSVVYRAGDSVSRVAWVLVIATLGSTQVGFGVPVALGIVVLGLVVALAYQFVYVQRFDYELTADTFDIESGVFSRRTREIPYRRVQNVDVSRNPIQRGLGLAEVRIETAGGGETEARLRFVSDDEARRLQSEIGRRKRGEEGGAERQAEAKELFAITPRELLLLGAVNVDLRLLSFVTALLPLVVPSISREFPLASLASAAPLLALGIVLVALLASSAVAVTTYYGFRLWRTDEELRYRRGLLQDYSGTVPLDKIQSVSLTENVLARLLGYASLQVETAGYAPGENGESQSAVPLAKRERVLRLAREVESFPDVQFERPPARARTRYAARYALVVLVVTGAAYGLSRLVRLPIPWFGPLALLALVPVGAHLKWRNLGYALLDDHLVTRAGFWTRTTHVVPYYRVQTVVERATVFQRRRSLATVVFDTAGTSGLTGRDAAAVDVDAGRAADLREAVEERLQTSLAERRRARSERRRGPVPG